jgi:hypothetical protein
VPKHPEVQETLTVTVPVLPEMTVDVGRRSIVKAGTERWRIFPEVGNEALVLIHEPPLIRYCQPAVGADTDPE